MKAQRNAHVSRPSQEPKLDLRATAELLRPIDVRSVALSGIFLLLVFYTLNIASGFFIPVVLAFLLNFILGPIVRGLSRFRIPEPLGAGVVLLLFLGAVTYGIYSLAVPVSGWAGKLPESLRQLESKLRDIKRSVEGVTKATEEVDRLTNLGADPKTQQVEVKKPGIGEVVLSQTQEFLISSVVMLALLYFLMASGDLFLRKLVNVLPRFEDKKRAVEISRQIEHDVSRYLLTVTLINAGFGTVLGTVLFFLGMPNPVLWGVMAALLNFIPYIGAFVGMGVLTLVAFLTFDSLAAVMLAPGSYFALNLLEEYLVLPLIMSHRLTLNPVVIFVWLIFWGWLWGIPGALLAVPLLAIFKIVCQSIEPLAPVAEFLSPQDK
ncbi:MAG: AI-2E family transporter [Candidatus Binatia bacterium]